MEDKPWQFCQNSNQQIARCSACPRRSATVDDKQSDGHSLNYRGKGRASNDPGPISDCTGCLVSSSQRHQGFFPSLALSCILLPAQMLIVKAGPSVCCAGMGLTQPAPATEINAYIITLPLKSDVEADIMHRHKWLIVRARLRCRYDEGFKGRKMWTDSHIVNMMIPGIRKKKNTSQPPRQLIRLWIAGRTCAGNIKITQYYTYPSCSTNTVNNILTRYYQTDSSIMSDNNSLNTHILLMRRNTGKLS